MEWTVAFTAILAVLSDVAPALKLINSTAAVAPIIEKTISALEMLVPVAVRYAKDEVAVIKNVILDLKSSGATTPEQLDRLDALAAKCDGDYDEATADANVADGQDAAAAGS